MHLTDTSRGTVPGASNRGASRGAPRAFLYAIRTAAILLAATASQANAQWAWRARLDNDAYNFWQHPAARTDEEYSNGVRLSAETYRAPWWARRLARNASCEAASRSTCVSHELMLAQEIYTPNLDRAPYTVTDWERERPYAAWLYVSSTARFARPHSLDEIELAAGVTGAPALGELAQTIAHHINERYTRRAHGWETQIGFEPGLLARYRRSWLARAATRHGPAIELQPFIGAAAGNILTNAEAGAQARVGIAVSHPWHVPEWHERAALEVYVLGGIRQEVVAHNFSLDGNTVNPDRAVERRPAVREHTVGIGARYKRITLSWRAVTRTQEYSSGPRLHRYGVMQGGIEVIP
ncbi:MAG TPA: lipid A deacylase LpxR family protein [Gemmatimonadaceae bacterium]|nr:lipid A deacylase LpxR family protein [Gemmatimonadaceae bacterium]